jgi:hypothetical protein
MSSPEKPKLKDILGFEFGVDGALLCKCNASGNICYVWLIDNSVARARVNDAACQNARNVGNENGIMFIAGCVR